jgi:threonine dehydratase
VITRGHLDLPTLEQVEAAAELIRGVLLPTPQINWPLLSARCGAQLWVKHENHNPTGAFKVRGGLIYLADLKRREPDVAGVVAATRGNHGQSIALAAGRVGLPATIVVPHGNSSAKNAAMRGYGAKLIEHGADFDDALEYSKQLADEQRLHAVPTFHPVLVTGVATYALELLRSVEDLHTVYVPIGLGSGICGMIAMRDALGLATRIVGVVAKGAPTYALSFASGEVVATAAVNTIADGLAVRSPDPGALDIIRRGADRIVVVDDDEIRSAMNHLYADTHNLAEGAGAAALAAALQEREIISGRRAAIVLTGSNIDREKYLQAIGGAA